ncbi:hypothetical protein SMICM17S_05713 [Streptomyces microflavus]
MIGDGPEAQPGRVVQVHYVGVDVRVRKGVRLLLEQGRPFKFAVGGGKVIKGWDPGVRGMKTGGRREIIVPPRLGYGKQSPSPLIPAGSTLIFVVDLLRSWAARRSEAPARVDRLGISPGDPLAQGS